MSARRLVLSVSLYVSAIACVLVAGAGSAVATTRFGEFGGEGGQLDSPTGVAVDAAGNVYVGDISNQRIDKFDMSGGFTLAWGAGVADGTNELQTCTTSCSVGLQSQVTGGFEFPIGVAVDDELSNLSYGDVYVVDRNHSRVEKYDSSGKFLLMFGGHVNQTTGGNVCVAGETCGPGVTGTAGGEFSSWSSLGSFIAVGPGGAVYVGDQGRVEAFGSSGVWKENISLSGLSSTTSPSALAVDSAGDVYVSEEGVAGVHEFEPNGTEKGLTFDSTSTSVTAVALDPSGTVYVADSSGGFHVLEYNPAGEERASFGSKAVAGSNHGMAFSDTTNELYASAYEEGTASSVSVLTPPPPGPLVVDESGTPGPRGTATLEATVDPENNSTSYKFEYVDDAHYRASGFASASSTPVTPVGAASKDFEDHHVEVSLSAGTLVPGDTYHWRIVSTDTANHTTLGVTESFEEIPPALIDGPWTANVAGTSVTLAARIDPLGTSTEYRLEYGTSTAYEHTLKGNVGEGEGYVSLSYHQQELMPGTAYHYRIVTISKVGIVEGPDRTFTTQLVGAGLTLSDGRSWELVSPPDKKGGIIEPFVEGAIQAAGDGSAIAYLSTELIGEGGAGRNVLPSSVLSSRGIDGWSSRDLAVANGLTPESTGERPFNMTNLTVPEYQQFSPDISMAVVEPWGATPLSTNATERTPYVRNNASGTYLPLVTEANVPAGTEFGGSDVEEHASELHYVTATPDLSHIVLTSQVALTPEAKASRHERNLYEWDAGHLQLVDILPNGEALSEEDNGGASLGGTVTLGYGPFGSTGRAISSDGRWIAWTDGRPYGTAPSYKGLFVRDMVGGRTFRVGGRSALFQTMSSDGSKVFFLEGGDLYVFDTARATQADITSSHGAGESRAYAKEIVSSISEDGSYVYFVAGGVLTTGAVGGGDNLYVAHEDNGSWSTHYIATLSSTDERSWNKTEEYGDVPNLAAVSSRISPDGRYFTFMSNRSLTGYDNNDAISGQPDEEVFLYDASSARLVCISCNTTGSRPTGVDDVVLQGSGSESILVDRRETWGRPGHWLAGSLPSWRETIATWGHAVYQPRYLSNSGRLFFNSPDALVPQDTNGLEDVYEYEPAGVGNCASSSATFSERSAGCVGLISSGQSAEESAFMDASESGDDAFFVTTSRLTGEDYDKAYDVYDAHVCSQAVPCRASPVSPPQCTSGDSCKAAPSLPPTIFGAAPSATFVGAGNVVPTPVRAVVKHKVKGKRVKHKAKAKHNGPKRHRSKKASKPRAPKTSGKGNR